MNPPIPGAAVAVASGWLPPVAGTPARKSTAVAVAAVSLRAALGAAGHTAVHGGEHPWGRSLAPTG